MWSWSAAIATKNNYFSRIFIIQIYNIETHNTPHSIHWKSFSLMVFNGYLNPQQRYYIKET